MKVYELTYEHPNLDWTWEYVLTRDYHDAICTALKNTPRGCRVVKVEQMPDHMRDRVAA
jgi:hypothetical protein